MQSDAKTPAEYVRQVPAERQLAFKKLRKTIRANLPKGFKEGIQYKMLGYFVPHSVYPDGYHCNPNDPLPFMNLASQKNSINFYHMGIYSDKKLLSWFQKEYSKHCRRKLDMGKSCIRFKYLDDIPYELIGELVAKFSAEDWIITYEKSIKKK